MRVWDAFLTERDRAVFGSSGYGAVGGFGERPAVIVVDVNYAFCGEKEEPILESIKKWRNSCGEDAWKALPYTQKLLAAARSRHIPVFFTTGTDRRPDGFDAGGWERKNTRSAEGGGVPGIRGNDIMNEIAPLPSEIVIEKLKPSAFHGTGLLGFLVDLGVDTLLVCRHDDERMRPGDGPSTLSLTISKSPSWRNAPSTGAKRPTPSICST